MLGNGALTVGLNEQGLVHDFYYPYVGLDNLTTARSVHHKIGVWVNNQFSWIDDDTWDIDVSFEDNALVSDIKAHNPKLELTLTFKDFVDSEFNLFGRHITVMNTAGEQREVRLFMHQVFEISRAGRGDTALYVPDDHYILDYKGRCALLIYGEADHVPYDQFAVGNYGIEGKEGTFRDAEDGQLSGSAVEHGGVDSVIRFSMSPAAHSSSHVDYWIVAADTEHNALALHHKVKEQSLRVRLGKTQLYWKAWLDLSAKHTEQIDPKYRIFVQKSLLLVKAHCDKRGGIIASCDSSIYNYGRDYYSYVWPRDGAYAIWPLIRMGYIDEAQKFFGFCRDILDQKGYLAHKFQPDKAIGSTWHPMLHNNRIELAIQEDETASVMYMLSEYFRYTNDRDFVQSLYQTFIQPAANFLASFIDEQTGLPHASYDLWEEKFLTTTYSTAVTYQALLVASEFADMFDHPDDAAAWKTIAEKILQNSDVFFEPERGILRKGFLLHADGNLAFDNTLDISSLYGVMAYGLRKDNTDALHYTVGEVERMLLDQSPSGGCPRYEYDNYFRSEPPFLGNPWFVTTLWLAQYYVRTKQTEKARHYLDWTMQHALPSGVLSEQVHPNSGESISVAPLVWSHAEFINTALDLAKASE